MNVLSLFSGIGGLDRGLQRAGMRIVGHVEIDPYCQRVLVKHWPEVPQHDDVRTTPEWWTSQSRPDVDIVAGGFPCQGHSIAGRQRGTGDERWGWPWFRDVIDAVNPPIILIENSPNLVRTGLLDVLADLAARGFDAWWGRVPAAAFGAPHLRWRLIVIAVQPGRIIPARETDLGELITTGYDGREWAVANPVRQGPSQWTVRAPGPGLEPARHSDAVRIGGPAGAPYGDWDIEPDVARVVHGFPTRVDRIKGLGNAVVPQVGEYIGHVIHACVQGVVHAAVAA